MDTQRELVDSGLRTTQIVDPDLGVGYTTTEPRLRVKLVLTIAITSCGSATQFVDPDLGVGYTATEPRIGVRLVLTIAITSCGTATLDPSSHLEGHILTLFFDSTARK